MLGIHELWLFVISGLLLNVTPGPDTAYIIWRGGAAAALGIACGCLVHVFGAAAGLSALLAASAAAFTLVKWIGAAYLCFIGVQMLLSRPGPPAAEARIDKRTVRLRQVFWQGALTNVLNPKVALFFLAFLPQFVAADSPHKALAFAALGLIFVCNGRFGVSASRRSLPRPPAASANPVTRWPGSTAGSALSSSASASASRCCRHVNR
jgi:threonine/homoserine/homoserine lactone efflux protein